MDPQVREKSSEFARSFQELKDALSSSMHSLDEYYDAGFVHSDVQSIHLSLIQMMPLLDEIPDEQLTIVHPDSPDHLSLKQMFDYIIEQIDQLQIWEEKLLDWLQDGKRANPFRCDFEIATLDEDDQNYYKSLLVKHNKENYNSC
jgi:hypothetical protein